MEYEVFWLASDKNDNRRAGDTLPNMKEGDKCSDCEAEMFRLANERLPTATFIALRILAKDGSGRTIRYEKRGDTWVRYLAHYFPPCP